MKKNRSPKWYGESEMCEPMMGMKNKKCMLGGDNCEAAAGKYKHKKCMTEPTMCEPMAGMKPMMDMDAPPMCGMSSMHGMPDMSSSMCGCESKMMSGMKNEMPMCHMLAHAYVPMQWYEKAFCPEEALQKGTLFPELFGVYPMPV